MVQFRCLRLYLGIESVSCHQLQRTPRINMNWNFKTLGQLFLLFSFIYNRSILWTQTFKQAWKGSCSSLPLITMLGKSSRWTWNIKTLVSKQNYTTIKRKATKVTWVYLTESRSQQYQRKMWRCLDVTLKCNYTTPREDQASLSWSQWSVWVVLQPAVNESRLLLLQLSSTWPTKTTHQ